MIVVGSTSPSPADAAASRRSRRRSKGGNGGGATRDEIELQKQSSDIQIQLSLQDSKQTDARVALLYKSAAASAGANTSVNPIRPDSAAWKTRESWLIDEVRQIIRVDEDQGPPRWYCPVEAAGFPENAPLLLCLPGVRVPPPVAVAAILISHQKQGFKMHSFFVKRKHEMKSSCRSSIAQVLQTLISRHPWCCRHSLQWIEHYTASTKTSEVTTLVGEVFQRIWNRSITESLEKSTRFVLASKIIFLLLGSWDSPSKAKKKGRDLKLLIVYCQLLNCL